ncbi:hypothetical protein C7447_10139 [Tenacibaculum adriaticum]|uniref:Uncharacterized protein n=1 Tax=Tenacibaculum adriaticum TaxID=413713 RepID=A0A5S5DU22_9FLAO|nr:hypothetical protein [Tenacibaculum adriaticum]TYP99443.1 hypothetical protein C7447_10139 [Tenacibaculum adriaticum]
MSNTISIKKCDNQLILFAVNENESYEICNVQSGNFHSVDLDIEIKEGAFSGTYIPEGGTSKDLSGTTTVKIPKGNYSLVYVGLNWGGPYNFEFEFNGETYQLLNNPKKELEGAIWNLGNLQIAFDVKVPTAV